MFAPPADGRGANLCAEIVPLGELAPVITSPADAACAEPIGALPFRFTIPLNATGLLPEAYTASVIGPAATLAYPPAAAE